MEKPPEERSFQRTFDQIFDDVRDLIEKEHGKLISTRDEIRALYKNQKNKRQVDILWSCRCGKLMTTRIGVKNGCCRSCVAVGARLLQAQLDIAPWVIVHPETFKRNDEPTLVRCPDGHEHPKRIRDIINGVDCPVCSNEKRKNTLDDAREVFASKGFPLLEMVYIDGHTPMVYRCKCGKLARCSLTNMRKKEVGCFDCQHEAHYPDFDMITDYFADCGCQLLSTREEYKGNTVRLKYVCSCGNIGHTSWKCFTNGTRCSGCLDERRGATMLKLYGVHNAFQSEEIKKKIRETCLEKYGYAHHMQNPEILAKALAAAYSTHPYTLPDGTVIKVQGYEDRALDLYLQTCLPSEIIIGTKIPPFRYVFQGKEHYYYPDFYIPALNLIIEVKSAYTLAPSEEKYAINLAKFDAVINAGYEFHLLVYDKDETVIDEITVLEA